jgi:hypothetical protein
MDRIVGVQAGGIRIVDDQIIDVGITRCGPGTRGGDGNPVTALSEARDRVRAAIFFPGKSAC